MRKREEGWVAGGDRKPRGCGAPPQKETEPLGPETAPLCGSVQPALGLRAPRRCVCPEVNQVWPGRKVEFQPHVVEASLRNENPSEIQNSVLLGKGDW